MLAYKPHTVEVFQPQDVSGALAPAVEGSEPKSRGDLVRCLVYPEAVDAAFRATGVQLEEPWRLYCEVCDAHLFAQGAHVLYEDRRLVVRARPQIHDSPLGAAHASVRLEALSREEHVL